MKPQQIRDHVHRIYDRAPDILFECLITCILYDREKQDDCQQKYDTKEKNQDESD
jgi:hypothetical protein